MSELSQAEKLRPLFTQKIRGRQRLCMVGECRKPFTHDTADGSLAYHIVTAHPEVAEQLNISHFRKRQRSDTSVTSASSSSSPPPQLLPDSSPSLVEPISDGSGPPPPLPPHPSLSLSFSSSASKTSTTAILDEDEPSILSSGSNTSPRNSYFTFVRTRADSTAPQGQSGSCTIKKMDAMYLFVTGYNLGYTVTDFYETCNLTG